MCSRRKITLQNAVKDQLEKTMHTFGYAIAQALVTDIEPDARVKAAMNEINAAQRLRVAANDRAEADKICTVKVAEADAESKYLAGCGIARQRRAIVDGLRESVQSFAESVPGSTPKDVMDLVLVTQYFDTIKEIGSHGRANTLFIPHSPGAVAAIANEVRNGFLHQPDAEPASSSSSSARAPSSSNSSLGAPAWSAKREF